MNTVRLQPDSRKNCAAFRLLSTTLSSLTLGEKAALEIKNDKLQIIFF